VILSSEPAGSCKFLFIYSFYLFNSSPKKYRQANWQFYPYRLKIRGKTTQVNFTEKEPGLPHPKVLVWG
jgi:hypothetical protein